MRLGRPLRIAYIVGAFPALSETFVVNQIVGMAARGHEVDIYVTTRDSTSYIFSDVERLGLRRRVYAIGTRAGRVLGAVKTAGLLLTTGWRAPRIIWGVVAEVRRHGWAGSMRLLYGALALARRGKPRYDVIHAQFGQYGVLALQLRRVGAFNGAIVTSFRGYDVDQYLYSHPQAYSQLFRDGELFLPVSRTLADTLIVAGCNASKLQVHHSGISSRQLAYRERVPSQGEVHLITVARLVEKKGLAYSLQAVSRLLAEGIKVSYTIVGNGPLRATLEALAQTLRIDEHVRWAGACAHPETVEMIRAAHVLIAPSVTAADGDAEGIPNVLKEAMALGLPVVATTHGGIAELVDNGVSGFLVPERDSDAIAERLAYLIKHPELWTSMGRAGRAKVEAEFDIDRLSAALEELYDRARQQQQGDESARVPNSPERSAAPNCPKVDSA